MLSRKGVSLLLLLILSRYLFVWKNVSLIKLGSIRSWSAHTHGRTCSGFVSLGGWSREVMASEVASQVLVGLHLVRVGLCGLLATMVGRGAFAK